MRPRPLLCLIFSFLLLSARCADDAVEPDPLCAHTLDLGQCAGVAKARICADEFCIAGASCSTTYHVKEGADVDGDGSASHPFPQLSQAAAIATAGDCIALAPGTYGLASLAGGVSLLGQGSESVTISSTTTAAYGLEIAQGQGGLIRGFTLSGNGRGILIKQVVDLRVEDVRIDGTTGVGLHARMADQLVLSNVHVRDTQADDAGKFGFGLLFVEGTNAEVASAIVEGGASAGVLALESSLHLRSSMVVDNKHFGVAIDCHNDPQCKTSRSSLIEGVQIARNGGVGLYGSGLKLIVQHSDIGYTQLHAGSARNVELVGQVELKLAHNIIHHSVGQGIVVDNASGTILQNSIEDNADRGLWLQGISGALTITENEVLKNGMTGIGSMSCSGVSIRGGRIAQTKNRTVLSGPSTFTVGDGLQILQASEIKVEELTIEDNERVGVLIDGAQATISNTIINSNLEALVVQNAKVSDQSFNNNKGLDGSTIKATTPVSAYFVPTSPMELVGVLPIPLP